MESQPQNPENFHPCNSIAAGLTGNQFTYGPRREKTCLWVFASNKSADQPLRIRAD